MIGRNGARRVLYMMPNAVPGGAERATMLMLSAHDRRRYDPAVLFFREGPLVDEARAREIEVHVLSKPIRLRHPVGVVRAIAQSRRIVREGGFALIHACMSYAHLVGGAAAVAAGVRTVLYQHGPVDTWMDGAATLLRCDRILVNSAYTELQQRARSWRSRPITIAPPAIDVARLRGASDSLAASVNREHGLRADDQIIGVVARFDPSKGIDVAIRAAAPLLRARSGLRLIVVGGQFLDFHPTYGSELRALVEREGVVDRVIFAGYRMDVRPYLARMTMLVHASQPEAFGLTIVEAMAAGVPVVVASGGGAAEIVDAGVDGLLHTPGNATELREAMVRLLDDAGLRTSLASAGLEKVAARYTPARMMRTIEGVYDEVLGLRTSESAAVEGSAARHA